MLNFVKQKFSPIDLKHELSLIMQMERSFFAKIFMIFAESLKECILLYEQELKHQQMLNQQMAIAEYQSAQLDDLTREVEYNNMLTWINNNKN